MRIAEGLTDYFDEAGLRDMKRDLASHSLFVAAEGDRVIGFATVQAKAAGVAELSWLAVEREGTGRGIGSALLEAVVKALRHGFYHVETVDAYPGWNPGTPCAIYVKPL